MTTWETSVTCAASMAWKIKKGAGRPSATSSLHTLDTLYRHYTVILVVVFQHLAKIPIGLGNPLVRCESIASSLPLNE